MSEEATVTEEKTFTQDDVNRIVAERVGRSEAKNTEALTAVQEQLNAMQGKLTAEETAKEEAAQAKLTTAQQLEATNKRLEQMQADLTAKDAKALLHANQSSIKDSLGEQGLNPKFSRHALAEVESFQTVTPEGTFYKDDDGVAITKAEAMAKVQEAYPEWYGAGRPNGVNVATGKGAPEADHSSESIEQFRARREREGHYK